MHSDICHTATSDDATDVPEQGWARVLPWGGKWFLRHEGTGEKVELAEISAAEPPSALFSCTGSG